MTHPQIVKKELSKLVEEVKKSAKKLDEGSTVPDCDPFKLSYYLGDIEETYGSVGIFAKLYPEDTETKQMWRYAFDAHMLAHKVQDRFITECFCRKKMK